MSYIIIGTIAVWPAQINRDGLFFYLWLPARNVDPIPATPRRGTIYAGRIFNRIELSKTINIISDLLEHNNTI